jgi:hypothetical protein
MFRLSVLPDTALWNRASELGLNANTDAPYEVINTPDFSGSDLQAAEKLSRAADIFYNKGRAVAWFNQVLYPLKMKPHVFFGLFADVYGSELEAGALDSVAIEALQLSVLDALYTKAKKQGLITAVHDIVKFNGAWGRALDEGITTHITFHYDPDAVLGVWDIESFAASGKKTPVSPIKARVQPGSRMPDLVLL